MNAGKVVGLTVTGFMAVAVAMAGIVVALAAIFDDDTLYSDAHLDIEA